MTAIIPETIGDNDYKLLVEMLDRLIESAKTKPTRWPR
jgi:hypothetical protein